MSRDYQRPTIGPRSHDEMLSEVPEFNDDELWAEEARIFITGLLILVAAGLACLFVVKFPQPWYLFGALMAAQFAILSWSKLDETKLINREQGVRRYILLFTIAAIQHVVTLWLIRAIERGIGGTPVWLLNAVLAGLVMWSLYKYVIAPRREARRIPTDRFPRL